MLAADGGVGEGVGGGRRGEGVIGAPARLVVGVKVGGELAVALESVVAHVWRQ